MNVKIDTPADRNIEGIGTATSLGWVKDIPVTFGRITIDADMLVCDKSIMKNQDIILGFPWLHDAGMILNTRTDEIILTNCRGYKQCIPIKSYQHAKEFQGEKEVFCYILQSVLD